MLVSCWGFQKDSSIEKELQNIEEESIIIVLPESDPTKDASGLNLEEDNFPESDPTKDNSMLPIDEANFPESDPTKDQSILPQNRVVPWNINDI